MAIDWDAHRKKAREASIAEYEKIKADAKNRAAAKTTARNTDLAPVKTTAKPKTKDSGSSFFKRSSYFDDGYQFGDITKTILGTGVDVAEKLTSGFAGAPEKVLDSLAGISTLLSNAQLGQTSNDAMAFAALTGNKEQAGAIAQGFSSIQKAATKGTAEFVKKDLYNEDDIAKKLITAPVMKMTGLDAGTASVMGDKLGGVVKSIGNTAATKLVGTIFGGGMGYLMTGFTAGGGEIEEALKEGATFEGAMASGIITGSSEAAGGMLFNGVKLGGQTLTENSVQYVARALSGKTLQTLAKWGINTVGEGAEEVVSDLLSSIGKKLTYLNENEFNEIFSSQDAWESFLGGMITGGLFEGMDIAAHKIKGTDYVTGLSNNEQKVVDKEIENLIAEKEAEGEALTSKEKKKIRDEVYTALEKGYISTDTIESVLGGKDYESYKKATDDTKGKEKTLNDMIEGIQNEMNTLQQEYDTLNKMKRGDMTGEQQDRQASIKQELAAMEKNVENLKNGLENVKAEGKTTAEELKATLGENVRKLVEGSKLEETYRELDRVNEDFKADESKFENSKHSDAAKKTLQNAVKVKANNTNRVRDLVELQARIAGDTGTVFDFRSGEQIKAEFIERQGKRISELESIPEAERTQEQTKLLAAMKTALEKVKSGETVINGVITDEGVVLNLDSDKLLNRTTGHEITHRLEKTGAYADLKEALFKYAESKGLDIKGKLAEIEALYDGVENSTKAEAELVSELVGDYLLTDYDFIKQISVENRNVFQRLWDEVKYLCKVASAGSKEAREFEKVKRSFEKAYKEAMAEKSTADEGGVRYSFAGIKAMTHSIDTLDMAQRLEDVGKADPEEIRRQTGWFRGLDGMWRFEIDDSKMIIRDIDIRSGETKLSEVLEHPELFAAYPQLKDVTISAFPSIFRFGVKGSYNSERNEISLSDEFLVDAKVHRELEALKKSDEYRMYKEQLEVAAREHGEKRLKLSREYKKIREAKLYTDMVDLLYQLDDEGKVEEYKKAVNEWESSSLGKRYKEIQQELKKMDEINPQSEIENAFRESELGKRYHKLTSDVFSGGELINDTDTRSTLIHEIQHAVQSIEGFASGASPKYWKDINADPFSYTPSEIKKLEAVRKKASDYLNMLDDADIRDDAQRYWYLNDHYFDDNLDTAAVDKEIAEIEARAEAFGYQDKLDRYFELENKVTLTFNEIEKRRKRSPDELYRNTAGEIEARDATTRLTLSAEERKNTRPDIDKKDVVFSDGGVSYSQEYESARVNNDIISLIEKVKNNDYKDNEKVELGTVSEKTTKEILKLLGIDVSGYKMVIEARQVFHILKDHGIYSKSDKSMSNDTDIAKMEYAIKTYDEVRDGGKTQAYSYMKNGHNRTSPTILYEKYIGDKSYYVVQAVPETKKRTLYIVSAFIGKKGYKKEASQLINAKSLDVTAKTGSVVTSNDSISDSFENVNTSDSFSLSAESKNTGNIVAPMRHEITGKDFRVKGADGTTQNTPITGQQELAPVGRVPIETKKQEAVKENLFPMLDDETAEPVKDAVIKTVEDRITAKIKNSKEELSNNQMLLEESNADFDSRIAEAQAEYDSKKNKNTKVANNILRRIETLKRRKSNIAADYSKRISDIEASITRKEGALSHYREGLTKDQLSRLEKYHRRAERRLEADKKALDEEYAEKKASLQEEVKDKNAFISRRAKELYDEKNSMRKGVRVSRKLGFLLDLRKELGVDWEEFNSVIFRVSRHPNTVIDVDSEMEAAVRVELNNEFQDRTDELKQLDTKLAEEKQKLEEDADKAFEKFERANRRMTKQKELEEQMAELIGDTSDWKDKKYGLQYKVNTLRRNLRDVVRDANGKRDIAKADRIYAELQGKYNHNEAELFREANKFKAKYEKMKITKAEDKYIQMLGELGQNPDTTLTVEAVEEYYEKHKKQINNDKVQEIIKEARKDYDDLLVRVNKVLKEHGMQEIPHRKGYFPHFTEEKQGFLGKLFNWKTQNDDIPTDIAGMTESFNPIRSWQSFNKQRTGDDTTYSFMKGFDTYVHGALDWIYHIEDLQKRRAFENHIRYIHSEAGIKEQIEAIKNNEEYDADTAQQQIEMVYANAKNPLNNFVTNFRTATNTLAGKKSSMDRGVEETTNRKIYSTMTNISNRVNGNLIAGSISSAITNFIPITQSWGQVSPISSLKAMKQTLASTYRDDGTVNKSDFLTTRLRAPENLYKTAWDKIGNKVGWLMESIDSFTSQTVWRSKYIENIAAGMSENEAIKNADQFAENVIAGRSRGNMPTIFDSKNPLIKVLTAFQVEVGNQYGFMLKDMPQDMAEKSKARLVKGYLTMFVGAYAYNALYSKLVGRDAAFDPIGIIEDVLQDLGVIGDDWMPAEILEALGLLDEDDEEEETDVSDVFNAIGNFAKNVAEEIPYVGGLLGGGRIPISSALPYDGHISELWNSTKGVASELNFDEGVPEFWDSVKEAVKGKKFEGLTRELFNPVYYLAMPMGGGQLRKINQGLKMFFDDDLPIAGSYTDSGNLRFPVEKTPGNIVQAALFGQYASKNARTYFDKGYAPLKEKQIQEFKDLDLPIADYWKIREGFSELKPEEGKTQVTLNQKGDYIGGLDLPISKKNILINNIADREKKIDMADYDKFPDFEVFDFAKKNPELYKVLQKEGISVKEYKDKYEKTFFMRSDDFSWAANNPDKATFSKAFYDSVVDYRKMTSELYDIKADKDEDGNSISGSAKEKKKAYIWSLDIPEGAKHLLFRSEYNSYDDYNAEIIEYVKGLKLTTGEKKTVLEEAGFKVDDNGRITWD